MRSVLAVGLGLASLGLVACGGGGDSPGGGVVTPPPPPVTFTKWSDKLKAGAAVIVSGKGQETVQSSSGGVVSYTTSPVGDATVTQTLGTAGEPIGLKLVAAGRTLEFTKVNGDTFDPAVYDSTVTVARSKDFSQLVAIADPLKSGWSYQTLGVWRTGIRNLGFDISGSGGSFSIGETTGGSSIPTTTTAVFRGRALATYINGTSIPSTVEAAATLTANFAARSVRLTTSGFTEVDQGYYTFGGGGLEGTLTYAPGTNALTGTVTLATGDLTGSASAQFYGPAADEIGGQFVLGQGSVIGAFGAAKSGTTPGAGFVDWATSRQPGATNSLSGQAVTVAVTGGGSPATALGAAVTGDATFSETLGADGAPTAFSVATGGRTLNVSKAAGDTFARGLVNTATNKDKSATALFSDPTYLGQDYQSFGVWQSGLGGASGQIGAFSTGVASAGAAIPTAGTATFKGYAAMVRTSGGYSNTYSSSMTLTANFATRSADLMIFGVPLGGGQSIPGVTGTLTYAAGVNQMTGTASTTNGALTGAVTARFFGPAAQEVGGTFSLAPAAGSASLDRLTGAFGGRR